MAEEPFIISFPRVPIDQANQYAADLAAILRSLQKGAVIEVRRTRQDSQDYGATLAVILGTASVTAMAKGIAAWIARNSGSEIQISHHGDVIAKNLNSGDAARIAEAFAKRT